MGDLQEKYNLVLSLIELSEGVVKESVTIPPGLRKTYLKDYQLNRQEATESLQNKDKVMLKQLQHEILTPWNETNDADSKKFWKRVEEHGLGLQQENHLEKILKRGRIANFAEYEIVNDSIVIWQQEGQIDARQAAKLDEMLGKFEKKHPTH